MKHEPPSRTHSPDEPAPMVIHHPEQDETLLAQWLRKAMARGASFWLMVVGFVALVGFIAYLAGGRMAGQSAGSGAWAEVMLASTPEELQRVAEAAEDTEAGGYAGLMAATARYRDAINRMPNDREAAAPILASALEGYRTVQENAKGDQVLRRLAMVGMARTYETRNELADAISTYQEIAKTWPDTADGKDSAARAKLLQEPVAVAFYKAFSEYKPKAASGVLGPRGSNLLDNLPLGHPDVNGAAMPAPSLLDGPGVPAGSVQTPKGELPGDVFQKNEPAKSDANTNPALPDIFGPEAEKGGGSDATKAGADAPK